MDMGDEFPNAEVIGTDIAKIQPDAAPSNVFFQIDDAEDEEWTWEDDFDLVHLRSMQGAFMDWQRIALSLSGNGKQLRFCISLSGC